MTEDENGRIRASDEVILLKMTTDEFFLKLLVFKERLEAKVQQIKSIKNE